MARFIWSQTIVVVLGISLSGCKSGPKQGDVLDSLARQPQGSASADGTSYSVFQSPSEYVVDSSRAPLSDVAPVSATGHVDRLRSAAHSIKEALQIEPAVIPAADPTQLTNNPGPIQPQLFLSAAALCEQQGQLESAAEQYNRLLELDPSNRSALIGLGRLNHRKGDLDAAIEVYQTASQHHPNDPVILNDLGLCLARAGRTQQAMATLRMAIQLKPTSQLYRNNLAVVMVEANQANEAVALLQQTNGADVAHYNVAYMLQQRGHVRAAVDHFGQALRINPSFEPARQMLNQLTPQIGTMPAYRQPTRRGFRTSMAAPASQPLQLAPVQSRPAPVISKGDLQQASAIQATNLSDLNDQTMTVAASHVEPVGNASEGLQPVNGPLELRLPMPRRTRSHQGTLVPPSPGEVPAARAVNFLPVAD